MFKNIVPHLISIETNTEKIMWSYFLRNINFYKPVETKNNFHYKLVISSDINIPDTYDFRNDYFFKKGKLWFYDKKFLGIHYKFCYDDEQKIFYFNRALNRIPFYFGGLMPVGVYISDIINKDLFLNGYLNLRGCALKFNDKVLCFTAPGYNGKSTFIKDFVKKGAEYIAEDNLIIDYVNGIVFPSANASVPQLYSRKASHGYEQTLSEKNIILTPQKIDHFYLIQNSTDFNNFASKKIFFEFVLLNGLFFYNNLWIKSFIFENKLTDSFIARLEHLRNFDMSCEFLHIKNFDYYSVIKKYE